jgi:P27 family predicted phage terminase small subunit
MTKRTKRAKRIRPPSPPAHLSTDAARIWRSVVGYLTINDRLQSVDAGTIETYCMAVTRQRQLQAAIDHDGVMPAGKPHAALKIVEATAATVRSAAHCLGLTPAARKALPARKQTRNAGTKGADPWHGVLE